METETNENAGFNASEAAAMVVVAGVVTFTVVCSAKLGIIMAGKMMDAAVDTITLAKSKKSAKKAK